MKKSIFKAILLLATLLPFASCSAKGSSDNTSAQESSHAKILVAYFSAQGHTKAVAEKKSLLSPEATFLKLYRWISIPKKTSTAGMKAHAAHANQKTAAHDRPSPTALTTLKDMTLSISASLYGGLPLQQSSIPFLKVTIPRARQ